MENAVFSAAYVVEQLLFWGQRLFVFSAAMSAFVLILVSFKGFAWPKDWREAKIFIAEDIALFITVILTDVFYDLGRHWADAMLKNPTIHPVKFGIGQWIVFIAFGWLLTKKLRQWRYYA